MTKAEAFHTFWSSFGINAWDSTTVPDEITLKAMGLDPYPRITYEVYIGDILEGNVLMSASVWYRSPTWEDATLKADEIYARIGLGGIMLPHDDGVIWLKRGTPFYYRMADPEDDMIRRVYINIAAEYISAS